MLITVAKRDLQDALKVVSHTVSSGGSDISSHYLFRQSETGGLEVLSYNGRVFSACPVNAARIDESGNPFTIEAKRLNLLLDAVEDDVALKFSATGTETVVTSRGKNVFASLDPDLFPYWDEFLKSSKRTAQLPAKRLAEALSHAKAYTYDQEAKAPHLCVAEFRGGCLFSTDQTAVSIVKVEGMEDSEIRIFGKDIGSVISFLSSFKGAKSDDPAALVEVYEHDRALFLRRHDGAVFGESKFASRFPDFSVNWTDTDDHQIEVRKAEVINAVKFLASGARWDDNLIKVEVLENAVRFSMSSAHGKPISLEVPATIKLKEGDIAELPAGGFAFRNDYLLSLLNHYAQDVITLGVSKKSKTAGWVRVKEERGEEGSKDMYVTTVAWMKTA